MSEGMARNLRRGGGNEVPFSGFFFSWCGAAWWWVVVWDKPWRQDGQDHGCAVFAEICHLDFSTPLGIRAGGMRGGFWCVAVGEWQSHPSIPHAANPILSAVPLGFGKRISQKWNPASIQNPQVNRMGESPDRWTTSAAGPASGPETIGWAPMRRADCLIAGAGVVVVGGQVG